MDVYIGGGTGVNGDILVIMLMVLVLMLSLLGVIGDQQLDVFEPENCLVTNNHHSLLSLQFHYHWLHPCYQVLAKVKHLGVDC